MASVPTPTAQEYLKSIEGQPLYTYLKMYVEFGGRALDDVTEILIKPNEPQQYHTTYSLTFQDGWSVTWTAFKGFDY